LLYLVLEKIGVDELAEKIALSHCNDLWIYW